MASAGSLPMLEECEGMHELAVICPSGKGRGKITRSRMSARQKKLLDLLELAAFTSR